MTDRPFNDENDDSGDTSLYRRLDELLDSDSAPGLDRITARRLEDAFIAGFRANFGNVVALAHPGEGTIYDVNPEKEFYRHWDEHQEAKRQLLRAGLDVPLTEMPVCHAVQVSLVRKQFFGQPRPRLSVIAACWSPLEALAQGSVGEFEGLANIEVLDDILERALVQDRQYVYHYIALCSTTGWDPLVMEPLPEGGNYSVALVEPKPPGWIVHAPPQWPPALVAAIEPEDQSMKMRRLHSVLQKAEELCITGGLLLIEELAERAVTPYNLALEVAHAYTREHPEVVVERVEGSMIVRRKS